MNTNKTNLDAKTNVNMCQNIKVIFRLDYAMKLKAMGHDILFTKPNRQKPWFECFYFYKTDALLEDLKKLQEEDQKNE